MSSEAKFYDLGQECLDTITKVVDNLALPFNIKIKYFGNTKLKKLLKLQKTNDITSHLTGVDLVILMNEDYFIKLEEKNAEILIYQELDRLEFDIAKGTFKIAQFPLQTTPGVLKKYGIDAVAEANELSELVSKQKEDSDSELEAIAKPKKTLKKDIEFLP